MSNFIVTRTEVNLQDPDDHLGNIASHGIVCLSEILKKKATTVVVKDYCPNNTHNIVTIDDIDSKMFRDDMKAVGLATFEVTDEDIVSLLG